MTKVRSYFSGIENHEWVRRYILNRGVQMAIDGIIAAASLITAHYLRFDGWPGSFEAKRLFLVLPYIVAGRLIANNAGGVYKKVWRYTSIPEGLQLAFSGGVVSLILLALRLST